MSEAGWALFQSVFVRWEAALTKEFQCCPTHKMFTRIRTTEMMLVGKLTYASLKENVITNETFQKSISDFITLMEKEIDDYDDPPDEVFANGAFVQRAATA